MKEHTDMDIQDAKNQTFALKKKEMPTLMSNYLYYDVYVNVMYIYVHMYYRKKYVFSWASD